MNNLKINAVLLCLFVSAGLVSCNENIEEPNLTAEMDKNINYLQHDPNEITTNFNETFEVFDESGKN